MISLPPPTWDHHYRSWWSFKGPFDLNTEEDYLQWLDKVLVDKSVYLRIYGNRKEEIRNHFKRRKENEPRYLSHNHGNTQQGG